MRYRLQECKGSCDATLRRACQPLPWRGATKVGPPFQGSGAGLKIGVRILQYVMQQAGNLLILVPAVAGNKTGHSYLMAE